MTFVVKTRGAGGPLMAEYRCPEHGVFEVLVDRDADGSAPDTQPCPGEMPVYEDDGELVECIDVVVCAFPSPWCISAPKPLVASLPCAPIVRGGDMKDRPPDMLDTRPLAEGMPYSEWKKKQTSARLARRHKQLVDKGVIQKKIIVG